MYKKDERREFLYRRIDALKNLETGWFEDGDDSEPPNDYAVGMSKKIVDILVGQNLLNIDVSADVEGGVELYVKNDDSRIIVSVFNDGGTTFIVKVDDKVKIERGSNGERTALIVDLTDDETTKRLRELIRELEGEHERRNV